MRKFFNGEFLSKTHQVLILFSIFFPIVAVITFSTSSIHRDLTTAIMEERALTAQLSATVLASRMDRVMALGLMPATREHFRGLVEAKNWGDALFIIESMPKDFPEIDHVFLTDITGMLIIDSPPSPGVKGKDLSHEDWYQGVTRHWKPYISDIYSGGADLISDVVAVAIPIFRTTSTEPVGILVAEINANTLTEWARSVQVGKGGFVYFVDKSGHAAAHPTRTPHLEENAEIAAVRAMSGEESNALLVSQGIGQSDRMVAYAPVVPYGWTAVVSQDAATAFAVRDETLRTNAIFYALILILALLLALCVFHLIEKMRNFSERLQEEVQKKTTDLAQKVAESEGRNQSLETAKQTMVGLVTDLEKEKQELLVNQAKDTALLFSIGEGIMVTDDAGRLLFVNPAAEEIFSMNEKEVVGRLLSDVVKAQNIRGMALPDYDQEMIDRVFRRKKKFVSSLENQVYYRRGDGTVFPAAVTLTPVMLGKKFIGVIGVFRNIEEEVALDRAKSDFVSLASHQLRTPLSTVNWYSELLLYGDAGKLKPEQKRFLEEVYRGSRRMVAQVNALLMVSRLESGAVILDPKPVNLVDMVRAAIIDVSKEIGTKRLTVHERFDPIPLVQVNPELIRTVIDGILSNAVLYTPDGGAVTVSLHAVSPKQKKPTHVLLSVEDTGYGIPKAQQGKIFTKLFRADNVREQDTQGAGLGLYIAKTSLKLLGGRIWFTSEEGKGSVFFVEIPIAGGKRKAGKKLSKL